MHPVTSPRGRNLLRRCQQAVEAAAGEAGQVDADIAVAQTQQRGQDGAAQGGKAGDVFYITNNLPYAMAIEMGHSQQAPQGMVRTTAEEFADAVKTALGGA